MSNTNSEYLPVKQSEVVETNIGYSTKIAKQVMLGKLNATKKAASEKTRALLASFEEESKKNK